MPQPGALLAPGAPKPIIPGVYFSVTNIGASLLPVIPLGRVAVIARATKGPLTPTLVTNPNDITQLYGTPDNSANRMNVAQRALEGGAKDLLIRRWGDGTGSVGTGTLLDTTAVTPITAVTLTTKDQTAVAITRTIRNHPSLSSTTRQLIIAPAGYPSETFNFLNNATDGATGEPQSLVNAVAKQGSQWITATKNADGNKILATVSSVALTGGANPAVNGAGLANALSDLEPLQWNVLIIDDEITSDFTTLVAYRQRLETSGRRRFLVVGEDPASISVATMATDAASLNDWGTEYVASDFKDPDGTIRTGREAAARVAGMIASAGPFRSLDGAVMPVSSSVNTAFVDSDLQTLIQGGALVFRNSASGPKAVYGINTYVNRDINHDAGWSKYLRTAIRWYAMDGIAASWDALLGQVRNNDGGRQAVLQAANRWLDSMVNSQLISPTYKTMLDPALQSVGDVMYIRIYLDDIDTAAFLIGAFGFSYAPPATLTNIAA